MIELFFDAEAEEAVRALWRRLVALGSPAGVGVRPHLSVASCPVEHLPICRSAAAAVAAETAPIELTLGSWGAFPGAENVLFLAPVVTGELLAFHAELHRRVVANGGVSHPYYRPGRWVPHCTIASAGSPEQLAEAVRVCHGSMTTIRGRIESVGVVEYAPRREDAVFRLKGPPVRGR